MQERKPGSKKRKKEETSFFQNILQLFNVIVTGLESHDYEGSITAVSIYMRVILAMQSNKDNVLPSQNLGCQ